MSFVAMRLVQRLTNQWDFPGSNLLASFAVDYLAPAPQLDSLFANYLVTFDLNKHISRMAYFGLFEVETQRLVRARLRPGDVFFDVGANIGVFSLLAASCVGDIGQVHAFEPIAANIAVLQAAIKHNHISQITVHPIAVGGSVGSQTLYIGTPETSPDWQYELDGWASKVPSQRRPLTITVPLTSLDTVVQQHHLSRVDLIKLDIEGGELDALRGARDLLQELAPDIICEISPYLLRQQNLDSRELTGYLAELGYTLFYILPNRYRLLHRIYHWHQPIRLQQLDPGKPFELTGNMFCTRSPKQMAMRWTIL